MSQREWTEVTRQRPCPACGKGDGCAWAASGDLKCRRATDPPPGMRVVTLKETGAIFRHEVPTPTPSPRSRKKAFSPFDGEKEHARFLSALDPEARLALARELGVRDDALAAIGCGWATQSDLKRLRAWGKDWTSRPDGAFTFPERDGTGRIVGFGLRSRDGNKGAFSGELGAHRGLVVPDNLGDLPDPVVAPEGATDVAACLTMGLTAVGRPSNSGGADALAEAIRGRRPIVLGENDCKTDGLWPGRDGARSVSGGLSERWGTVVSWKLPPKGVKDARAWLQQRVADGLDLGDAQACREAGQEFLAALRDDPYSVPLSSRPLRNRPDPGA